MLWTNTLVWRSIVSLANVAMQGDIQGRKYWELVCSEPLNSWTSKIFKIKITLLWVSTTTVTITFAVMFGARWRYIYFASTLVQNRRPDWDSRSFCSQFDVTALTLPRFPMRGREPLETRFWRGIKFEDLTKSKNFCAKLLHKISLIIWAQKVFWR